MIARVATLGFTLIELMIALVVGALLIIIAMPSFSSYLRDSEIRATTESVANGLRVARTEALRRNLAVGFTLVGGAGSASWTVNQVTDNASIQTYSKQEGGSHTTVAIQPAQAISVTFNGLGRIAPAAATATPNLQQLDISSTLASGGRSLRIYVDDTHGLRMCDPSPALTTLVPPDPRAC
jgi:type IV fimbrial biogenesis protein FimT